MIFYSQKKKTIIFYENVIEVILLFFFLLSPTISATSLSQFLFSYFSLVHSYFRHSSTFWGRNFDNYIVEIQFFFSLITSFLSTLSFFFLEFQHLHYPNLLFFIYLFIFQIGLNNTYLTNKLHFFLRFSAKKNSGTLSGYFFFLHSFIDSFYLFQYFVFWVFVL